MRRTCSIRRSLNTYKILVREREEKKPVGIHRRILKDNIAVDVRENACEGLG
jgi:hypothetical protein